MFLLALQGATLSVPNTVNRPAGGDLSQMPIGDALSIMFQLMSKDANDDLRGILSEMDQLGQKKAAMRDAEKKMANEMQRLKALSRASTDTQSNQIAQSQIAWARQLPTLCGKLSRENRDRCLEDQVRARTAELRKLPTPR